MAADRTLENRRGAPGGLALGMRRLGRGLLAGLVVLSVVAIPGCLVGREPQVSTDAPLPDAADSAPKLPEALHDIHGANIQTSRVPTANASALLHDGRFEEGRRALADFRQREGAFVLKLHDAGRERTGSDCPSGAICNQADRTLILVGAFLNGSRIIDTDESKGGWIMVRLMYPSDSVLYQKDGSFAEAYGGLLFAVEEPCWASTMWSNLRSDAREPPKDASTSHVHAIVSYQLPERATSVVLGVRWAPDVQGNSNRISCNDGLDAFRRTETVPMTAPVLGSGATAALAYYVANNQGIASRVPDGRFGVHANLTTMLGNSSAPVFVSAHLDLFSAVSSETSGWGETLLVYIATGAGHVEWRRSIDGRQEDWSSGREVALTRNAYIFYHNRPGSVEAIHNVWINGTVHSAPEITFFSVQTGLNLQQVSGRPVEAMDMRLPVFP